MNVPIAYIILKLKYPVYYTTIAFVVLEIISLGLRLFMANHLVGMRFKDFYKNVFYPTLVVILIPMVMALIPHFLMPQTIIRFILVTSLYGLLFIILMFKFALEKEQRTLIITKIKRIKNKL